MFPKKLALFVVLVMPAFGTAGLPDDVVSPSVQVRVAPDRVCGSGTVVDLAGKLHVLTAGHVVAEAKKDRFDVYFDKDGKEYKKKVSAFDQVYIHLETAGRVDSRPADVVWYSPFEPEGGHDIALLVPRDATGLKAAMLLDGDKWGPELGEDAWYIGAPEGVHHSLEKTILNRVDYILCEKTYYLVNGNGWFGSSGGGVFVKRGGRHYLTGVVSQKGSYATAPMLTQTLPTIRGVILQYQARNCKCDSCKCKPCGGSCEGP